MRGRPPKYNNAKELEDKINEYFEDCKKNKIFPLITGLALHLGFESRQSFYDYEKHDEYSYIIKRARLKVESGYEAKLLSQNTTGAIFGLKNMGWTDKQEIHADIKVNELNYNGNYMPSDAK
jgi:hypothetical protein